MIPPVGFRDLMSVEASGAFFHAPHPWRCRSHPSQIYRLTRAGLSLPDASALQFVRFTLYEAGEGIFAAIMLLFCGDYFLTTFADVKILGLDVVWIGVFMFGFKFVQVGGVLLLCLLPGPIQKLGGLGLKLGHALHVLNDERYERYLDFLTTQVISPLPGVPFRRIQLARASGRRAPHAAPARMHVRTPLFRTSLIRPRSGPTDLPRLGLDGRAPGQRHPATRRRRRRRGGLHLSIRQHVRLASICRPGHLALRRIPAPRRHRRTVHGHALHNRESIYHRWDRRLENTVHVAHGDWGSVKRRAGIAYRPTASQPSSPERKVTRSQTGDLTVKMPKSLAPPNRRVYNGSMP